jgi:peroxiredoxin
LCERQDEFTRLNTRVIIVSFGTLPAVQQWIRDTCVTFDVVLDSDRHVYQAYQLESSRWRSWTLRTLWTYAKLLMQGRRLQPKDGDPHQLGGDFIIDANGKIQLAYRSHDPVDRPPVDDLLEILAGMQS